MTKEFDLDTYLIVTNYKFIICLFDKKNLKSLYKKELVLNDNSNLLNFDTLKVFLDTNIFKIEKLNGKFVENIFCIIQNNNILNLNFGIKKKKL